MKNTFAGASPKRERLWVPGADELHKRIEGMANVAYQQHHYVDIYCVAPDIRGRKGPQMKARTLPGSLGKLCSSFG
jgi:hypothetical protein